jgi:hypothetical protein
MMQKKAQGISMNTIIIAAIALLVLVIVSVIFMSRMGWFAQNSNDCKKFGGDCTQGTTCQQGYSQHPIGICYNGNEVDRYDVCCVKQIS